MAEYIYIYERLIRLFLHFSFLVFARDSNGWMKLFNLCHLKREWKDLLSLEFSFFSVLFCFATYEQKSESEIERERERHFMKQKERRRS